MTNKQPSTEELRDFLKDVSLFFSNKELLIEALRVTFDEAVERAERRGKREMLEMVSGMQYDNIIDCYVINKKVAHQILKELDKEGE